MIGLRALRLLVALAASTSRPGTHPAPRRQHHAAALGVANQEVVMQMQNHIARGKYSTMVLRSPGRLLGIALSLAAVAAVSFAVLAGAPPAQAHSTSISMGWGHGGVTASHQFAYACDDRGDSRNVYTEYIYDAGFRFIKDRVYDHNGSVPGCSQDQTPGPIVRYRVCRDERFARDTCSAWRST